jgi:polyisoprenyl-teichoic acid--peptidoglycan teichoic acid transferase
MSPTRSSRRREHWARRRKIAVLVLALIVLIPFVAAGWYARDITNAIGDAQRVSVVELPTRNPDRVANRPGPVATPDANLFATPSTGTTSDAPAAASSSNPGGPSSIDITRGLFQAGTGSDSISPREVWPDEHDLTILVLGVDALAEGGDQNADVIILARLDLQDHSLRSVSIPRDLEVEIPGHGPGKINGAYGIGLDADPANRVAGVAMMRDTIEYNFGILIDDYVLIDFDGFKEVVDALGGIVVNVPETIVDDAYPTEDYGTRTFAIEEGRRYMDGETALAYARTRHQDNDDKRRERQMLVIEAMLHRGQEIGSLTRVADLITALSGAALTSFEWDEQLALASLALRLDTRNLQMANVEPPLIEPGTSSTGAWIYTGDMAAISDYVESMLSGERQPADSPSL